MIAQKPQKHRDNAGRAQGLLLCWLSCLGLCAASCSSPSGSSLEGKQCTPAGRCIAGYTCSAKHICVREGSEQSPSEEAAPDAGRSEGKGASSSRAGTGGGVPSGAGALDASVGDMPQEVAGSGHGATDEPPSAAGTDVKSSDAAGAGSTASTHAGQSEAGSAARADAAPSIRVSAEGSSSSPADAGAGSDNKAGAGSDNKAGAAAGSNSRAGSNGSARPSAAGASARDDAAACGRGGAPCGAHCVELDSDMDHCGACGKACTATPRSAASCTDGTCQISCRAPLMLCGTTCASEAINVQHCGACDRRCADSERCNMGKCDAATGAGLKVDALSQLLASHDITLQDFADNFGVAVEDLGKVEISESDLPSLGISDQVLSEEGISRGDLARVGVNKVRGNGGGGRREP